MADASARTIEQLRDLNKQLSKAAGDARIEDAVAVLKQLKSVVEPTEEVIRVSGAQGAALTC